MMLEVFRLARQHCHYLDVDDIITALDLSHSDIRRQLDSHELYPMTYNMAQEIYHGMLSGWSVQSTINRYRITWSQFTSAAYNPPQKRRQMHSDILEEIKLDLSTQQAIADKYGVSQALSLIHI